MKTSRLPLLLLALCSATAVVAGESASSSTPSGAAAALPSRVVQPREVSLTLPAEGVVEALHQATVAAQVAGRVVDMRVDAGQAVKKGEVLMRLDVQEAAEANAAAQATLINARANYERTRSLRQQNFLSQAALDKAKADLDAAQAGAAGAGAGQSRGTITSPLTGLVAKRLTELGEMAALGRPLVTVYDPAGLRVTVDVPQYRLSQLRQVKSAQVEFPELGKRVESASVQLLPAADASTHTAQLRVNLPAELKDVVPGMAARAHFVVGKAVKLTVPAGAVVRRGEVAAVYVQEAGSLKLRQLRLGEAVGDGEIEVLAGLKAGETIILDPVKGGIALKQAAPK
ncbi:MAG TPA: efflux RND transporter periplasmic adaptor subunit [Azospira sp.]|nr:efflux RND transporter periplasmic adaptor subunit [Azospira sp.]